MDDFRPGRAPEDVPRTLGPCGAVRELFAGRVDRLGGRRLAGGSGRSQGQVRVHPAGDGGLGDLALDGRRGDATSTRFDPKPSAPKKCGGRSARSTRACRECGFAESMPELARQGAPDRPRPELLARQQRPLLEPGLCALGRKVLADSDHDRAQRGVGGVVSAGPAERIAGLCRGARDHAAGPPPRQPVRGRAGWARPYLRSVSAANRASLTSPRTWPKSDNPSAQVEENLRPNRWSFRGARRRTVGKSRRLALSIRAVAAPGRRSGRVAAMEQHYQGAFRCSPRLKSVRRSTWGRSPPPSATPMDAHQAWRPLACWRGGWSRPGPGSCSSTTVTIPTTATSGTTTARRSSASHTSARWPNAAITLAGMGPAPSPP